MMTPIGRQPGMAVEILPTTDRAKAICTLDLTARNSSSEVAAHRTLPFVF